MSCFEILYNIDIHMSNTADALLPRENITVLPLEKANELGTIFFADCGMDRGNDKQAHGGRGWRISRYLQVYAGEM
jgi:hypothetical protein